MERVTRLKRSFAALVLVAMTSAASAQTVTTKGAYDELRAAIEKNWNLPSDVPNAANYTISLRLHLTPEGVVTLIEVLDDTGDPGFRTLAESARRAVLLTQHELGRMPIPKDKISPTIVLRWPMKLICEQRGGC